jgi:hypothetical protein
MSLQKEHIKIRFFFIWIQQTNYSNYVMYMYNNIQAHRLIKTVN